MLPSVFPRHATDSAGRVFPGVWKPLFLKFPSRDRLPFPGRSSLPTSFVSLFVFYIFSYLFSKTMVCFSGCLMSSASIQKLFCGVCSALKCSFEEFVREKVVFQSYSSAILGPPAVLPSLNKFSSYFDPHSQRLRHSQQSRNRCFFLELSCFFDDPTDVGNLIFSSSAFSKSSLNIWKFMIHILLKPEMENFEHYFTSM